ncbi:hypothetical protein [Paenibacillus alvei]|nr:hypothetical protein [Paenibacillus alvei]
MVKLGFIIEQYQCGMKQAMIEIVLDLGYENVYLKGYLVADDFLVVIEDGIMWLYYVVPSYHTSLK